MGEVPLVFGLQSLVGQGMNTGLILLIDCHSDELDTRDERGRG